MEELLRLPVMEETIRDVPGYEDTYYASSLGKVFSKDRYVACRNGQRLVRGRELKGGKTPVEGTHLYILSRDGKKAAATIQGLMYLTFPDGYPPVEDLPGEIWKPHPEYQYFHYSNMGRVKRIKLPGKSAHFDYFIPEREQATSVTCAGINLSNPVWNPDSKQAKRLIVSRAVYEIFVRPLSSNELVQFIDGDRYNCALSNLKIKVKGTV